MPNYLSPEVHTREVSSGGVAAQAISTSVPAFSGTAPRGPINRPFVVLGIEDFSSICDGDDGGDLYQSLVGFFDNGGERCYVNRISHYTDITDATTLDSDAATVMLDTGVSTDALAVWAANEGSWGNSLSVTIEHVDRVIAEVTVAAAAGAHTQFTVDDASQVRVGMQLYIADATAGGEVRIVVTEILPGAGASGADLIRCASSTVTTGGLVVINNPTVTKETFNLTVLRNGVPVPGHSWRDLSMSTLDTKFCVDNVIGTDPTLLDPRQLIYVDNQNVAASATVDPRPNEVTAQALAAGDNGGSIVDADYVGNATSRTGLRAFDYIDQFAMTAIPGVETSVVQNALNDYAADRQDHVAFMDAPEAMTPTQVRTYKTVTANLAGTYGAMFVPRLRVLRQRTGTVEDFPAVGYVLGRYAATDRERSVSKPAAGVVDGRIRGVVGVARNNEYVYKGNRDIVGPDGINPIFSKEGRGVVIWGQNTLDPTDDYGALGVRRGFIYLRRRIASLSEFVLFEPNTKTLQNEWKSRVKAELRNARKAKILQGDNDDEAFYLRCDRTNNPPSVVFARGFYGRVGCNIVAGIEWAVIEIEQDKRSLAAELAAVAA